MAANNYYGLPQVSRRIESYLEVTFHARLFMGSPQWGNTQQQQLPTQHLLPGRRCLWVIALLRLPLLPPLMRRQGQQHQVCCLLPIPPILRYEQQ